MTGRIHLTPEAERQLNQLDEWITEKASAAVARRFVSAILDRIDGILAFPLGGRARDDVRPGMRTTTFKKRTLIAYEVDESFGGLAVNISASSTVVRTGRPHCSRARATRRRVGDASVRGTPR